MNRRIFPRGRFAAAGAGAFATLAMHAGPVRAARFQFRCASTFPLDHPSTVRMRQMWDSIEKESGGQIQTKFFPAGVLGGDSAMIPQVRIGALDFYLAGLGTVGTVVPLANIFFLGFAFGNNKEGLGIVDGPLGDYVRGLFDAQSLHACRTTWASGMLEVSSSLRQVHAPDDLKGFKLRVAPGRMAADLFKSFGADPVSVNNNEIYSALQTKLIDGQASPLVLIESGQLYETQKYISLTNHQCGSFWLLCNSATWKGLSPELQEIVERNNTKAGLLDRRDTDVMDASLRDKLSRRGLAINTVDQAPFRARLGAYYRYWEETFGAAPWALLQKSLGRKLT